MKDNIQNINVSYSHVVVLCFLFGTDSTLYCSRSQWRRGLRGGSTAPRLLGFWFRISPGAWISVCVESCLLSGRGICDGLITRSEKSYRL